MILIEKFPLPPTVNNYLMPIVGQMKTNKKTGKPYRSAGWIKTAEHRGFEKKCEDWMFLNQDQYKKAIEEFAKFKKQAKADGKPLSLCFDAKFVFYHKRIFKEDGGVKRLDADNRLKPCIDAVSKIFAIDDCHFFAISSEKVSCKSEAEEGSIIRISAFVPNTLSDILRGSNGHTTGIDGRAEA